MTAPGLDDFRQRQYDVFVSYKREDDEARAALVAALEAAGYEVFWDAKLGNDDWKGELRDEINRSKMVICLWSARAAKSENVKAEAYGAFQLKKLLSAPVEDISVVPDYFQSTNLHLFDGWADETRRATQMAKILGTLQRETGGPSGRIAGAVAPTTIPVEFGDIPGAPPRLVGRETELAMLRAAWASAPPRKVNAVVLNALGGAGKSALLRTFANDLLAEGGGGAARIYGWSAYSQGSGEQKHADADSFISKALGDFGFAGEPPRDSIERARTLAKLIQRHRTLLLLDGLEPLQDPPGVNKGRFKDKGLAELVKVLANQNRGLVVLTTRQEVPELEGHGALVIAHPLEQLSDTAGADLLVELGVRGRQRELEAAVRSVDGHALSVTLLGSYIAEVCGGDIRHRDEFDFADIVLTEAQQEELATDKTIVHAKRAAKVMHGYLEQFERLAQDGARAGLGGPEGAILNLLGLFDRPADGKSVHKLLEKHIPGLTDELFFVTAEKRFLGVFKYAGTRKVTVAERTVSLRGAKGRLRKLQLLGKANPKDPYELDAHPVVRAYFAGRLEKTAPEAGRKAHDILYRHYATAAPDRLDTLEKMQPLFHAVQHGVKAGRAQEVFDEILLRRLEGGFGFYIINNLGAFGPYLAALAHFFDPPWREPRRDLSTVAQSHLLHQAAFALAALGRLADSVAPRKAALEIAIAQERWASATRAGTELSDTLLMLGRTGEAAQIAEAAVAHADASNDAQEREVSRAMLAAALAAAGDLDRARDSFFEAEMMGKIVDGIFWVDSASLPLLSVRGYRYGDLILAHGDTNDALARGCYQLDLAERYLDRNVGFSRSDIGLAHLLIGRAEDELGRTAAAAQSLDAAIVDLREGGRMQFLPLALLVRAAHRRRRAAAGERALIDAIRADLTEVEDIAGNEMRLHLTDLALERARLALDVPAAYSSPEAARAEAQSQTTKAAHLIADTGYDRRDPELADLRARLAAT